MADVGLALRGKLKMDPAHQSNHEAVERRLQIRELSDHVGRDAGTYPERLGEDCSLRPWLPCQDSWRFHQGLSRHHRGVWGRPGPQRYDQPESAHAADPIIVPDGHRKPCAA
jgi:hypothetical protein